MIAAWLSSSCTSSESCPAGNPSCQKNSTAEKPSNQPQSKGANLRGDTKSQESETKAAPNKDSGKEELLDRLGLTGPVATLIDKGKELRDLRLLTLDTKTEGQESEMGAMQKVHDLMNGTVSKGREEIHRIQSSLKASIASIKSSQETEKRNLRDEASRAESELSRMVSTLPPEIGTKMQTILKDLSAEYSKIDSETPDNRESSLKNIDDFISSLRGETYQIQGDQNKSISDQIDKIAGINDRLRTSFVGNFQRIEELSTQLEKAQAELAEQEGKARSGHEDAKSRAEVMKGTISETRNEFFRLISLVDESRRLQAELIDALEQGEQALRDYLSTSEESLASMQKSKDSLNSRLGKSIATIDSKIKDLADDLGRRGDTLDADGLRLVNDSLLGTTAEMEGLRNQMSAMQNIYFDAAKKVLENQHEMTLLLQGLAPEKRDLGSPAVIIQTALTEMNGLVQTNKQNIAMLSQRLDQQLDVFEKKADEVTNSLKDARVVIDSKAPCQIGSKKRYGNTVTLEVTCGEKTISLIVR
jgi:predicted  nucleic acid-binding Zn-ribbon protein